MPVTGLQSRQDPAVHSTWNDRELKPLASSQSSPILPQLMHCGNHDDPKQLLACLKTACSQHETPKHEPHSPLPDILPRPKQLQTAVKLLFPLTSSCRQSRLACPSWCVHCFLLSVPSQAIAAQRHKKMSCCAMQSSSIAPPSCSPAFTPDTPPCMGGMSS